MKQLSSSYKGNHKTMYIVPISDLHLGNKCYDSIYLSQALQFVQAHRNQCRIILLGDLLETATKTSVGRGVYDESYSTQKQLDEVVKLFRPYSDIIDMVELGNHEDRVVKDTSIDLMHNFCGILGIPDKYVEFSGILNVNVGEIMYSIYGWHGATGGTKEGSAINALLSMRERVFAHCMVMGHTHKLLSFTRKIYLPTTSGSSPAEVEQLFVNTGAALSDGGYGEQKGFSPSVGGFGAIELFRDTRKMVFHRIEDLVK